jgi:allantoin racemase
MKTKILWQSDNSAEHFSNNRETVEYVYENMLNFAKSVARPTTEFVLQFPKTGIGKHFVPFLGYHRAMLAPEILGLVKAAEEDGFDAAFPGMCFGEFFLQDARQAVAIPVVGPAESAMIVAQLIGRKFAIITNGDPFIPVMEESIRFHGWTNRAIAHRPVRAWDTDVIQLMVDAYNGRPERLVEEFDKLALECVRDGADVVICGCNPYGAALSQIGYNTVAGTGVPVVTALPSMIKLAETLVDLRRSVGIVKSEAVLGRYRSSPAEVLADLADRDIGTGQRVVEALGV